MDTRPDVGLGKAKHLREHGRALWHPDMGNKVVTTDPFHQRKIIPGAEDNPAMQAAGLSTVLGLSRSGPGLCAGRICQELHVHMRIALVVMPSSISALVVHRLKHKDSFTLCTPNSLARCSLLNTQEHILGSFAFVSVPTRHHISHMHPQTRSFQSSRSCPASAWHPCSSVSCRTQLW